MKKFSAHLLSTVLIPFFIPTYLFAIIFFYFPQLSGMISTTSRVEALVYIFGATTLLPLVLVFVLYKLKVISSLDLYNRKDRYIPQVFATVNYLLVCLYLMYKVGLYNALTLSVMASTFSLLLLTFINRYWKISTHTAGAFGMLGVVTVLYLKFPTVDFTIPYFIILFCTTAVCVARWYLKAHTLSQIIAGCFLGSITGSSLFYFLLT